MTRPQPGDLWVARTEVEYEAPRTGLFGRKVLATQTNVEYRRVLQANDVCVAYEVQPVVTDPVAPRYFTHTHAITNEDGEFEEDDRIGRVWLPEWLRWQDGAQLLFRKGRYQLDETQLREACALPINPTDED